MENQTIRIRLTTAESRRAAADITLLGGDDADPTEAVQKMLDVVVAQIAITSLVAETDDLPELMRWAAEKALEFGALLEVKAEGGSSAIN